MSFEQLDGDPKKRLHGLLLTMEQEVETRKGDVNEYGENPYFEKRFQQGDHRIVLLGTKHSSKPEDIEKDAAFYREVDPEILLHEGNDLHEVFPGMTDEEIRALKPEEVMKSQEQIFLAWRAFADGKVVQTWDLPFKDQITIIAKRHKPEAIAGCLASIALSKIYENGTLPSREALEMVIPRVLSEQDREDLAAAGIDLSTDAFEAAVGQYLKTSLSSLAERYHDPVLRKQDNGSFHGRFDPAYPGETNEVLRDMNVVRDQHAIDVLEATKGQYKNVLAIAGGSHVRTWGPAVAELCKPNVEVAHAKVDQPEGVRALPEIQEANREKDIAAAAVIADGLKKV